VCGAIALLLFFTPIMAVIAVIIFAWDQGPILYTQTRVGQNGRLFPFFKFRSMVRNADTLREGLAEQNEASGPIFKIRHDPRVTPIGRIIRRYSLDELPQLFNVLKGDISLVGPRPHRPCEVAEYRPHHYYRLLVPQGLICLREVSGRSKLSFERWIELDLQYVEHRSFGADFKILCRVIPAVFRGDGAY
jgi:lipopolysaccharide/colanic/teichoic acid biosynthesis glycosyltransferase